MAESNGEFSFKMTGQAQESIDSGIRVISYWEGTATGFGAVFDDLGEVARRVNLTMPGRRFNLTTPASVFGPERQTPLADRFVGHHDPALREEIFDVPAN